MVSVLAAILGCAAVAAGEKAPPKVLELANAKLLKLGSDPAIVKAVQAENAKGKSLAAIRELDAKWIATPGVADFMRALIDSECGKHLAAFKKSNPFVSEMFVMDNQGANVAMSERTSDYWQGDEAKFTECVKRGTGVLYLSDVKLDDSTQRYSVQVSVPVKDGDAVIGAICIGVDIEKL